MPLYMQNAVENINFPDASMKTKKFVQAIPPSNHQDPSMQ